jgi:hypothetical protein
VNNMKKIMIAAVAASSLMASVAFGASGVCNAPSNAVGATCGVLGTGYFTSAFTTRVSAGVELTYTDNADNVAVSASHGKGSGKTASGNTDGGGVQLGDTSS